MSNINNNIKLLCNIIFWYFISYQRGHRPHATLNARKRKFPLWLRQTSGLKSQVFSPPERGEKEERGERREERCRDCRSALQEAEGWRPVQGRCTDRRAAGYKGELSPLRLIPCWLGARYEQSENPCKHRQDLFDKYYVNSARCVLYQSTTQSPSNIPPVVRSPLAASQTRAKRRPRSRMTAGRHLLPSIRWRARSDSGAEADIKERAKRPVWRDKSTFSGELKLFSFLLWLFFPVGFPTSTAG